MNLNIVKMLLVLVIFIAGIFSGFSISRINQFQGVSEALVAFGDMHYLDRHSSVSQQIEVYEAYEDNIDRGRKFQKRLLAILYDEGASSKFILEHVDSKESDLILTNNLIAEFLTKNPLDACRDVPVELRLECSLKNKLVFENAEIEKASSK